MSPYGSFEDPYCSAGGQIQKNKQQIQNADDLERFENNMVAIRFTEPLPEGNFESAHYRSIHHHLFQDVYDWAGQYRTIRIAKAGSMFCYPEHIEAQMETLFSTLKEGPLAGAGSQDDFIAAAAILLAEINAIHPFREGNGRTQLTFLFLVSECAWVSLGMARIKQQEMLDAMIASVDGNLGAFKGELGRFAV